MWRKHSIHAMKWIVNKSEKDGHNEQWKNEHKYLYAFGPGPQTLSQWPTHKLHILKYLNYFLICDYQHHFLWKTKRRRYCWHSRFIDKASKLRINTIYARNAYYYYRRVAKCVIKPIEFCSTPNYSQPNQPTNQPKANGIQKKCLLCGEWCVHLCAYHHV